MKLKYILIVAALSVATAFTMDAQVGRRFYIDAGWQFNGTFSNNFVRNASGWGAYAEGGYYILPHVGVGAFASFNTNNEYFPRLLIVPTFLVPSCVFSRNTLCE